jgi:hypothetical protein
MGIEPARAANSEAPRGLDIAPLPVHPPGRFRAKLRRSRSSVKNRLSFEALLPCRVFRRFSASVTRREFLTYSDVRIPCKHPCSYGIGAFLPCFRIRRVLWIARGIRTDVVAQTPANGSGG